MLINDTVTDETAGNQILHPGSRKLFVHWEAQRAERPCPHRGDLDLSALRDVLPDLVIIERDNIRSSFRYRLSGTRVCDLFRRNLTSTDCFSGWDGFESDVIRKHFSLTVGQFQPTLMRMRLSTDTNQVIAAEFIGLPVRTSDGLRVQIVGGVFPFRPAAQLGHKAVVQRELLAIRSIWTEHSAPAIQPERNFRVISGGLAKAVEKT